MIKTILVPIDGSDHAFKALDLAADIAEKYDARIIVLHSLLRRSSIDNVMKLCEDLNAPEAILKSLKKIVDDMYAVAASNHYGIPALFPIPEETLRKVGTLIIEKAKQTLLDKGLKDISTHILDDAPANCILSAVDHEQPDMIVMGSRGLGKLSGLLMGSVSSKVSHLAPCTCVTVK